MSYPSIHGELFRYHNQERLTAFKSGSNNDRMVIFLPGIGGGMMDCDYIPALGIELDKKGWSLVQVLFQSCYESYGFHTLQDDTEDLDQLVTCLINKFNVKSIVLLGFSTGCQDIIWYLKNGKHKGIIKGVILHGPISDRLAFHMFKSPEHMSSMTKLAQEMKNSGKTTDLLPRNTGWGPPLTPTRWLSMTTRFEGDEDMFSWDLTDSELSAHLGHVRGLPFLVVFLEKDEFVPEEVRKLQEGIGRRILDAVGGLGRCVVIPGASHYLGEMESWPEFFLCLLDFLDGK